MVRGLARDYDSSRRQVAARETRQRILATAYDLLVEEGYAALTITALAERAGVSPQTIYNSVGGKAEVLKATYDVTLAGDDEPVAMSDRPQLRAMREAAGPGEFLDAYTSWCSLVSERVNGILGPLLEAGGDQGVAEFIATIEQERRAGTTGAMTAYRERFGLPRGQTLARVVDQVWTLNSPEVHDRLVRRCGWSARAYRTWLRRQLATVLGIA